VAGELRLRCRGFFVGVICLGVALAAGSCTTETPPPDRASAVPVLSRAPRQCSVGLIRADSLPVSELNGRLGGHVPTSLPSGFGLLGVWGEGDGYEGLAVWADARCRQVLIYLWPQHSDGFAGPRVGPWTVIVDAPGDCFSSELGSYRCLDYRARVDEGTISVVPRGFDRAAADPIVLSVPL
jgi:hypothetical protein